MKEIIKILTCQIPLEFLKINLIYAEVIGEELL